MEDWRKFDDSRDWSQATPAEKMTWASEATVELFKKAGLFPGDVMDRTKVRRLTFEQMQKEDDELDRLLNERLRNLT